MGPELVGPELVGPELVGPELVDPELVDPELVDPEIIARKSSIRGALARGSCAPGILSRCMDPAASPEVQTDRAGGKPREPTIAPSSKSPSSKAPTARSIRRAPSLLALIQQGTPGGNPIR
jgi:hypothetical protein